MICAISIPYKTLQFAENCKYMKRFRSGGYHVTVSYTHLDVYKRQLVTQSQNINKSNTSPHNQQTRINYHASYDRNDKAGERDDTQNRDNYRRNYTPPTHSVKQHSCE